MPYSNFTLEKVRKTFHLEAFEEADISSDIKPLIPSAELTKALSRNVPVAKAINTEKATSEMIVANVLLELREHFERRISLFSGIDFNVDDKAELTGVCDFLVSLSPVQFHLEAPIIILVEAEKDVLTVGFGQCVAEMVAAQRFNAERANDIRCV